MDGPYRDREWLDQKYHGEGLTQREIAEECGVSPTTIRKQMKAFGIETREVRGENHGLYGKERSEEVKEKISAALMNREISATTRQLISAANRGRPTSPEAKEKISISLTGLTRPMETRAKMSQSTAGEQNPNWRGGYSRRYGAGWAPARTAYGTGIRSASTVARTVRTGGWRSTTSYRFDGIGIQRNYR